MARKVTKPSVRARVKAVPRTRIHGPSRKLDKRLAVYAGSFDPITNGHLWIIQEGSRLFGRLIVAIGSNSDKQYTFAPDERVTMVKASVKPFRNVEVVSFADRFLVDYARECGAGYILRGIRNPGDYAYELNMRNINADLAPEIASLFLMPPRELAEVSSSFVKGLVGPAGWKPIVKKFLPNAIHKTFIGRMK